MNESKGEWLQRVADMHGLDPEDICEIAEMCLEASDLHLACLSDAQDASNLLEALRAAHNLKAGSIVGQDDISRTAGVLEDQLKAGDFDALLLLRPPKAKSFFLFQIQA